MWTNLEALPRTKNFPQFEGCDVPKCVHEARVAGIGKWCKSSRGWAHGLFHQEISAEPTQTLQ